MRSLAEIVKANREAEKLGVGVNGAIGTKGGPDAKSDGKPGFVNTEIAPDRAQKIGLGTY